MSNQTPILTDLSGGQVQYYRLNADHSVSPMPGDASATLQWAYDFTVSDRRVARDEYGDVTVSTVFLGLDHNFLKKGPPLIFETMVFGGPLDQEQTRASTWDEAVQQHKAMCQKVVGA